MVSTQPAPLHLDLQEQCPSETPRAPNFHQMGQNLQSLWFRKVPRTSKSLTSEH